MATLYDDQGQEYSVPDDLFDQGGGILSRTLSPNEKQIQVFLEDSRIPEPLRAKFWALYHKLALIKVTSREDYYVLRMQIENLIRSAYINSDVPDEATFLGMEMLEFDAGDIELRRSITYDGKPNERELWGLAQIHQKIERVGESDASSSGGSSIGAKIYGLVKGRR